MELIKFLDFHENGRSTISPIFSEGITYDFLYDTRPQCEQKLADLPDSEKKDHWDCRTLFMRCSNLGPKTYIKLLDYDKILALDEDQSTEDYKFREEKCDRVNKVIQILFKK